MENFVGTSEFGKPLSFVLGSVFATKNVNKASLDFVFMSVCEFMKSITILLWHFC